MRVLVALVVAQALVASAAIGSSLHVHVYRGHDHPDHHHGPATHEHEHSTLVDPGHDSAALEDHGTALQADSCDPGRHAVTVTMACASVSHVHVDLAEVSGPTIVAANTPIQSTVVLTDVRVHGPPFAIRIPSRGPPRIAHV